MAIQHVVLHSDEMTVRLARKPNRKGWELT